MVTNHADTSIWGEATAGDVIEGRMWLKKAPETVGATLELCYEWYKIRNENKELIAASTL